MRFDGCFVNGYFVQNLVSGIFDVDFTDCPFLFIISKAVADPVGGASRAAAKRKNRLIRVPVFQFRIFFKFARMCVFFTKIKLFRQFFVCDFFAKILLFCIFLHQYLTGLHVF